LLYFGKNYQESFDLAQSILNNDPNSFLMRRMQFLNKAAMEQYPEAQQLAEKFFSTPTSGANRFTSNDYTSYGDVLSALGQDSLAIIQIEKAVEINPDKADLLKKLSSAYYGAKVYDKAAEAFQKYIDAGEYSTNDLFVLAGRYMTAAAAAESGSDAKKQAVDNAIKYVDMVIAKVPDDYRIHQRKARILIVANDNVSNADASAAYQQTLDVLNADPENIKKHVDVYREAYNSIGSYYILQKDNDKAREYYGKMLELDPENEALKKYIENLK
ncbi:MAG: tetratricopeptide repeat protein, partial [Muribaculaceae bacterium]|nr:tetratricopeptide repeat protein [Muribaculaceae bacterium]